MVSAFILTKKTLRNLLNYLIMRKLLTLFVASIGLFACSKDAGSPSLDKDEFNVAFEIKAPASGAVIYRSVPEAIPEETAINSLYVFVFGPNPDVLAADVGTTNSYILEGLFSYENLAVSGGATVNISDIKVSGKNLKRFYFVANHQVGSTAKMPETTMFNYGAQPVNDVDPIIDIFGGTSYVPPGMPMSYVTEIDFSTGSPVPAGPVAIDMLRTYGRIDVVNGTENYRIEKAQFYSRGGTFLFGPNAVTENDGVFTTIVGNLTVSGRTTNYGSVMYTYGNIDVDLEPSPTLDPEDLSTFSLKPAVGYIHEAPASSSIDPFVRLKCVNIDNSSDQRMLDIPFESAGVKVPISRNNVYKFYVSEVVYGNLKASIEVEDWNTDGGMPGVDEQTPVNIALTSAYPVSGAVYPTFTNGSLVVPAAGGSYTIECYADGIDIVLMEAVNCSWISNVTVTPIADGKFELKLDVSPYVDGAQNRIHSIYLKTDRPTQPSAGVRVTQVTI